MLPDEIIHGPDVMGIIEDYRDRCLWFLRPDFTPSNETELLKTLEWIEKHGDAEAYRRTGRIKTWLRQRSKPASSNV